MRFCLYIFTRKIISIIIVEAKFVQLLKNKIRYGIKTKFIFSIKTQTFPKFDNPARTLRSHYPIFIPSQSPLLITPSHRQINHNHNRINHETISFFALISHTAKRLEPNTFAMTILSRSFVRFAFYNEGHYSSLLEWVVPAQMRPFRARHQR